MIIRCGWCLGILKEPGALLFTPPHENGLCVKIHLCVDCYKRVHSPPLDARCICAHIMATDSNRHFKECPLRVERKEEIQCGMTKAPGGWYCTRVLNHPGPCAAIPISVHK
jgi:hypothetical protein